jgi:hypothetical protein
MFTAAIICLWFCVPATIRVCFMLAALRETASEFNMTSRQLSDILKTERGRILWMVIYPTSLYLASFILFLLGYWE